jgi:hypothetical protein
MTTIKGTLFVYNLRGVQPRHLHIGSAKVVAFQEECSWIQ